MSDILLTPVWRCHQPRALSFIYRQGFLARNAFVFCLYLMALLPCAKPIGCFFFFFSFLSLACDLGKRVVNLYQKFKTLDLILSDLRDFQVTAILSALPKFVSEADSQ